MVFFYFQSQDHSSQEASIDAYLEMELDKVEFSAFIKHLSHDAENNDLVKLLQAQRSLDISRNTVRLIQNEPQFIVQMRDRNWLELNDNEFVKWQQDRDKFEALWESSFSQKFYLKYNEFSLVRLWSHQFLHGSFMHLLGNMVFLALLGTALEGAVGARWFLLLYLGAGFISGLGSLSVNWGDMSGGLGASGAIAGLMGAYSAVFGSRKIKFFYWFVVYFGYFTAPALMMLPVWLGWELVQWLFSDARIAYDAHAFGIMGGGFLGWLATRHARLDHSFMEEAQDESTPEADFRKAQDDLASLRVDLARTAFKTLSEKYPDNEMYALQWFRACAMKFCGDELHVSARKVLLVKRWDLDVNLQTHAEFKRYMKASKGKMRLSIPELSQLVKRFILCEQLDDAENILLRLIASKKAKGQLDYGLDVLLSNLMEKHKKRNDLDKFRDLRSILVENFPASHVIAAGINVSGET